MMRISKLFVFPFSDAAAPYGDSGERIGAGGQALGPTIGQGAYSDWRHTDAWTFIDSCDTPTTYAIHAVDESGIAAVLADFTHWSVPNVHHHNAP